MQFSRRATIGLLAFAPMAGLFGLPAQAAEPETFQTDGVAINGIDPVGYFDQAKPVPGSAEFELQHNGATWRFASAENRAAFKSDPEKYGARFGGYCAYAASKGYLAPTVPEAWAIHEGRLYLNFSLRALELWQQDIPGNIAKGEKNWPGILG